VLEKADILNSILQASMFVLIPNYCVKNKNKISKSILAIISVWISLQILMKIMGNSSISVIMSHLLPLGIVLMFYKKDKLDVIISYSILYLICGIIVLFSSNTYFGYIQNMIADEHVEIGIIVCIYFIQYILALIIFINKDKIYRIYRVIRSRDISIVSLLFLTIVLDFAVSLDMISNWKDNYLFKEYIYALLLLFIVLAILYFAGIEKKMREISKLNYALEEKLEELKKVKHDYGAQISYLYGVHLMKDYERAGKLLKDIINGNNSISDAIEVYNDSSSIIAIVTRGIAHNGINVILDENVDLNEIEMTEYELQKVISNIVKNSVTAMERNGILTIKTYENFNGVVIKIQNNGPKIEEEMLDKIFESGFSTKVDDKDEHGFGLAIVKEILDKYKGTISVESGMNKTEFIIKIPRKININ